MIELRTFDFNKNIKDKINNMGFDRRWPLVYITGGNKEVYIGEPTNAYHILLTRGIKGSYIYVCDEPLKQYIETYKKDLY